MILKDKVVFILGIAKFDGPFESTSYTVAKFLAKDNQVFYIDYPYTWKDFFKNRDEAFLRRAPFFSKNVEGVMDTGITHLKVVITPPLLSINFLKEGALYRWLLKKNERIISERIKKVIKVRNLNNIVFINSFNFHYPNVGRMINAQLYAYHCVDPLIVPHDKRHGIISEQKIVEQCDLVICTSKQLLLEKSRVNQDTYFIPNAADVNHSAKARQADLPVHPLLAPISKPVVGYFGNIERRIDFVLLEDVTKLQPAVSFVFAGPRDDQYIPKSFTELPNVYFIGRIPYDEMPSVIKGFEVAMIPFKKDEVSQTIFPLKLFEYLGSGKPVVSTDFNLDLLDFTADTIKYASNAEAFSTEITRALTKDTLELQSKRISIAANNSWDKRLTEFSELLNSFYTKKR